MGDEIKIIKDGKLSDVIDHLKKESFLKEPKLVRIAYTFVDSEGNEEVIAHNHKSYTPDTEKEVNKNEIRKKLSEIEKLLSEM